MRICFQILTGLFATFVLATEDAAAKVVSSNICQDSSALAFLGEPKNFRSLDELVSTVVARDLVLIGEIHFDHQGVRAKLIEKIASRLGYKGCLFYELEHDLDIRQKLKEFSRPGFEPNYAQFNEMHRAAVLARLTEKTVDMSFAGFMDEQPIMKRNRFMAQKIRDAFRSGQCEKGLMFVGKSHVLKEESKQVPLQAALESLNIKTVTINLQAFREKVVRTPDENNLVNLSWNGVCANELRNALPKVAPFSAFENANLPGHLRLFPRAKSKARWSELEWTLLVP